RSTPIVSLYPFTTLFRSYVVPVLLAASSDGLGWGISFALATGLLRFGIGIDQMPLDTLLQVRILNEVAYLAVVGDLVQDPDLERSEEYTSELQSPCNLVC